MHAVFLSSELRTPLGPTLPRYGRLNCTYVFYFCIDPCNTCAYTKNVILVNIHMQEVFRGRIFIYGSTQPFSIKHSRFQLHCILGPLYFPNKCVYNICKLQYGSKSFLLPLYSNLKMWTSSTVHIAILSWEKLLEVNIIPHLLKSRHL